MKYYVLQSRNVIVSDVYISSDIEIEKDQRKPSTVQRDYNLYFLLEIVCHTGECFSL